MYSRPATNRNVNVIFSIFLVIFLIAPFFLNYAQDKGATIFNRKIVNLCLLNMYNGGTCPGCGLTRSFIMFTHGEVYKSLQYHRLGIAMYFFCIYLLLCEALLMLKNKTYAEKINSWQLSICSAMIMALALNWFLGLFFGGNGI